MPKSADRRSGTRIPADFEAQLALGPDRLPARVQDISTSGVRCLTSREIPVMTHVQLVLTLPSALGAADHAVSCSGAVVRSDAVADGEYDTAVFFTDLLDADRIAIEDYVAAAG